MNIFRLSALVWVSLFFVACGATNFVPNKKSEKGAAETEVTAFTDDCYNLKGPHQNPGQAPGGKPVIIDDHISKPKHPKGPKNPCLDEPVKGKHPGKHPGQTPGQNPGQNPGDCFDDCSDPCADDCGFTDPCDGWWNCWFDCNDDCGDDGFDPIEPFADEPNPFPTQQPFDDDECGVKGKVCPGHPGQWPGQTIGGGHYDRKDVEGCFQAFQNAGYDTKGMWGIDTRKIRNVSVLTNDIVEDRGFDHNIVIIKSVNVLGSVDYRLLNPNALYCIQSTSVMEDIRISSCRASNVVYGKNVNVLSRVNSQVVNCP